MNFSPEARRSRVLRPLSNVLAFFQFADALAFPRWRLEATGVLMLLQACYPQPYGILSRPVTLLIGMLPLSNMVTATCIMRLLKIFQFISTVDIPREDALAAGAAADLGGAHLKSGESRLT
jgi:hypothetical protein